MLSIELVISAGIIFILILLAILFLLPAEEKMIKKKKIKKEIEQQKDWQKTASKHERHIASLRKEIEKLQSSEKDLGQNLVIEKANVKKWQEKLSQERTWQEKENQEIEKSKKQIKRLQTDLIKSQESFSKEHTINLRVERSNKEIMKERDDLFGVKRTVETENLALKSKIENYRQEIAHLKKDNAELQKKQDDVTWVAKTDYIKLETELKEKEVELNRLYRELKSQD